MISTIPYSRILYSTCKIRGLAFFLIPRTAGSFVCKWLRPSNERNRDQIKEQEKALFNGLPLPLSFPEEHKPDIECLFAKTADIVRALTPSTAVAAVALLGCGAKCIGSWRLQGHPHPSKRRTERSKSSSFFFKVCDKSGVL